MACRLFAKHGFEGTHIRQVGGQAGVNAALVYYYFTDKQGLYRAVQAEARARLSRQSNGDRLVHRSAEPERLLQASIESLMAKLSGDSAWIAHLVARELTDGTTQSLGTISEGLRADLTSLEDAIGKAIGPEADPNLVRLNALTVLGDCIFDCTARGTLMRVFPSPDKQTLSPQRLVPHLARLSLRGVTTVALLPETRPEPRPERSSSGGLLSQFNQWRQWIEERSDEPKRKETS